jgi:hypothetical protein
MGKQRKSKTLSSKINHERQKGMYLGPCIQIVVPKGRSVNAKYDKGKGKDTHKLYKLKKKSTSNWSPWCQVVAWLYLSPKAVIQTGYLKQEKVVELPYPPYPPALCYFFSFSTAQKHLA